MFQFACYFCSLGLSWKWCALSLRGGREGGREEREGREGLAAADFPGGGGRGLGESSRR